MAKNKKIYQIKATISDISPPIWRRIAVPDSMSLESLHLVLQRAFGWENYHLHSFEIGGVEYGPDDDDDWGMKLESEATARVGFLLKEGMTFSYLYDFGDSWEHKLKVEKVTDPVPGTHYPVCLAGRRACPPEDCGGVWGYQNMLEALSDPSNPEHDDMLEWVGENFDPEKFKPVEFKS